MMGWIRNLFNLLFGSKQESALATVKSGRKHEIRDEQKSGNLEKKEDHAEKKELKEVMRALDIVKHLRERFRDIAQYVQNTDNLTAGALGKRMKKFTKLLKKERRDTEKILDIITEMEQTIKKEATLEIKEERILQQEEQDIKKTELAEQREGRINHVLEGVVESELHDENWAVAVNRRIFQAEKKKLRLQQLEFQVFRKHEQSLRTQLVALDELQKETLNDARKAIDLWSKFDRELSLLESELPKIEHDVEQERQDTTKERKLFRKEMRHVHDAYTADSEAKEVVERERDLAA